MSKALLEFLDVASQAETLFNIRREVLGETEPQVVDDDSESMEEEEEEEEPADKKKKNKKNNKLEMPKRNESPTLQALVDKYNPNECADRSTDFSCLLSFIDTSISDLDFSTRAKNGNISLSEEGREMMRTYLEKMQKIFMFSQRPDRESIRGVFVKATRSHKAYILKRYKSQPQMGNDLHENVWRRIMHADRGVVLNLMDKKAARERYRLENKYEIEWSFVTRQMRKYISYLELPDDEFTTLHAVALEFLVECNAGPRKISVLDPIVRFYTYDNYMEHLDSLSLTKPTVFRIGDEDSSITITDVEAALSKFKRENMLVQVGVAKDKNQRDNQYLLPSDDRWTDGAVVFKPTCIFSAADTIRCVDRIRRHFDLSMKTRPTDSQARVKMGRLIHSRAMTAVLKADWAPLYNHAARHGFDLGSHIFRKIDAVAIASPELGYLENIHQLTGRRLDAVVLQAHVLRHSGSYATVQAYSNIHISWGLDPKILIQPDKALLRNLLSEMEFLREEYKQLKIDMSQVSKASLESVRIIENSDKGLSDVEKAINKLRKRGVPAKWRTIRESDEDIRFVLYKLREAGAPLTKKNAISAKVGSSRFSEYRQRNNGVLLPDGWTPGGRKEGVEEETAAAPKRKREEPTGLPAGAKVIVPQQEVTGKKRKVIAQRNKQKVKRDAERFGGPDNVTTECEGGNITKAVEIKGVVRDICTD